MLGALGWYVFNEKGACLKRMYVPTTLVIRAVRVRANSQGYERRGYGRSDEQRRHQPLTREENKDVWS